LCSWPPQSLALAACVPVGVLGAHGYRRSVGLAISPAVVGHLCLRAARAGEGTHGGRVRSYLRIGGRSGPGNMTIEQMVWIGRPAGLLCSAAFGNLPIRGDHRPRLLLLPEAAGDYAGAD
jgi:hypothetical protein